MSRNPVASGNDKLRAALLSILNLLEEAHALDSKRFGVRESIDIAREALGNVGLTALSAAVEGAEQPSEDLDHAIAVELQRPQLPFTSDITSAMALTPLGWRTSWASRRADSVLWAVELSSPDGAKTVKAVSTTLALALCAASLEAMED